MKPQNRDWHENRDAKDGNFSNQKGEGILSVVWTRLFGRKNEHILPSNSMSNRGSGVNIVLIIAWSFEQLDGSSLRFYFTLKEFIKRKYTVTVIHAHPDAAAFTEKHFGCRSLHVNVSISRWDNIIAKIIKYIIFVIRARKLLKTISCDAIYSISLLNNLVCISKKNAQKNILYVDFMSNYYRYRNPGITGMPFYYMAAFLEKYTMLKADRIIVITEQLKKFVPLKKQPNTYVIPDGADTQKFLPNLDPLMIRKKYSIPDHAPVIGYQGGIEPHDGLQFLVSASPLIIHAFPEVRFLVAGKGSFLDEIKRKISQLHVDKNWIFAGWVENNLIPYFVAASNVNIVPVPNDPATAPLITFRLLESMAAGAIIVANDLPGMKEIADETMIFFTDVENPSVFASHINKALVISPEEKKQRSHLCRKKIESLDWRIIAQREVNVLSSS